MAALTVSDCKQRRMNTLTANTLGASDTYVYQPGDILIFRNTTGGALTATLDGDTAGNIEPDGLGIISVSTGNTTGSIAAGAAMSLFADTRALFYQGTVEITGASGMTALIIRR